MDNNVWNSIKQIYLLKFGIPDQVVDYVACERIVRLCVEGRSNKYISRKLRLPQKYIKGVLKEFLEFEGWKLDLDISPIMVYDSFDGDWYYYRTTIKTVSSLTTSREISLSFQMCKKYNVIRKEIRKYVK